MEYTYRISAALVIPKTQKMVLYASLINTNHYKVLIKGEWSKLENGVAYASV